MNGYTVLDALGMIDDDMITGAKKHIHRLSGYDGKVWCKDRKGTGGAGDLLSCRGEEIRTCRDKAPDRCDPVFQIYHGAEIQGIDQEDQGICERLSGRSAAEAGLCPGTHKDHEREHLSQRG